MEGKDNYSELSSLFLEIPDEDITPTDRANAEAESQALATGKDIEKEAEENQHGRREKIRDVISNLTCWWVKIAALLLIATTIIWFWHLLSPMCLKWLSPSEMVTIKETLSNILVGAVFGYLAKERFM